VRLSLAPIPYFWPRERVEAFYEAAAGWPVDVVYLGEVVCGKRLALRLEDWIGIGERLAAAGKEVVLSTQALIEAESELARMERLCRNGRFAVEANDLGAAHVLAEAGVPFVVGPHVNVYNAETLALLAGLGARRWVPPVELPGRVLGRILAGGRPRGLEVEVTAYGRLALAFSARCFTARADNVPKDACELRCRHDPEGRLMETQDGRALFVANGVQIQSAAPCNLAAELGAMREMGVDLLRVVPDLQSDGEAMLPSGAGYHLLDGRHSLREKLDFFEKQVLLQAFARSRGNVSKMARLLKTDRANLHRKLVRYGIK